MHQAVIPLRGGESKRGKTGFDLPVSALRERCEVDEDLLQHLAPLGWDHVNLTGDYSWHTNKRVAKGRFRPLRVPKSTSRAPWRTKTSVS